MYTRRYAINPAGGTALAAGLGLWRPLWASAVGGQVYTKSRPSMGTMVTINIAGASLKKADAAFAQAFEYINYLEEILTCHKPSAPLGMLHRYGAILTPPPELIEVLREALKHAELSEGAFNPAVKPVLNILATTPNPDKATLADVMHLMDWHDIQLAPDSISLLTDGMDLTLDAIAKGYIVDKISDVLCGLEIDNYLITAGSDILARGVKLGGSSWKIGVSEPSSSAQMRADRVMHHMHIATGREGMNLKNKDYPHLISRYRPEDLPRNVTVIASSAMLADVLTTVMAVMPPKYGLTYIAGFEGASCLLTDASGAMLKSGNWPV